MDHHRSLESVTDLDAADSAEEEDLKMCSESDSDVADGDSSSHTMLSMLEAYAAVNLTQKGISHWIQISII